MTTATLPKPLTVDVLLFGEKEDAATSLINAMTSGDVGSAVCGSLSELGKATKTAAVRELGTVSAGLLDLDLTDVLVAGVAEVFLPYRGGSANCGDDGQ
jgi:hypothetical protein